MDLTDGAGNLSPLLLLANNLRAYAVTMLYGLIPFVRLPALALGVNAVLLGGLAACYAATDTTMLLYAASLLPHGIFELPALILAFSMGLYICGHLTRRCRRDPAVQLRRGLAQRGRAVVVRQLTAHGHGRRAQAAQRVARIERDPARQQGRFPRRIEPQPHERGAG